MNFVRSQFSLGRLLGQRCRHVSKTWTQRGMCNKPDVVKTEPLPAVPTEAAPRPAFKIPGSKPSAFDKKILIWSGRFKTPDQIPDLVSFETIDAARNKVRVKVCYLMMVVTIGACLVYAMQGKQAARRHESLSIMNMEKKAQWREEYRKEEAAAAAAAAAALAQKPQ